MTLINENNNINNANNIIKEIHTPDKNISILSDEKESMISHPDDTESKIYNKKNNVLTRKAMIMQFMMSILANLPNLSAGMGYGHPAITLSTLTNEDNSLYLTRDEATWFASINAIVCPLGCIVCVFILDKYGRKMTLYVINIISILSWLLISTASWNDKGAIYAQLLIARILIGIVMGMASLPANIYSAEIAHPSIRGRLTVMTSLFIAIGVLLIYVLGYLIPDNWRLVGMIATIISIGTFIGLYFLPESPSWLLSKSQTEEAKASLRILRGLPRKGKINNDDFDGEFYNLLKQKQCGDSLNIDINWWDKLKLPEVYKPLSIMCGLFLFQQFSGIFVVVVYTVDFCLSVGATVEPLLCVVMIGFVRVVAGFFTGIISDKFGRRWPTIIGSLIMSVCMMFLAWNSSVVDNENNQWLPITMILILVFFSSIGLLTTPFAMVSEMYPLRVRAFASSLTITIAYIFVFIVIKMYPEMEALIGIQAVLYFFGTISLLSTLFVFFIVPETIGKTLEEIEQIYKQ